MNRGESRLSGSQSIWRSCEAVAYFTVSMAYFCSIHKLHAIDYIIVLRVQEVAQGGALVVVCSENLYVACF
jgi:hypothetical protein